MLRLRSIHITLDVAEQSIQRKAIVYDGTGDEHYDAASALIKSMRGTDPDAAVYWVARMLEAGEDPRFIARRIAILATEDIGNADPQAILVAAAAFDIVEKIGMPEAQLTLGQAAIYMATAPKSNASAMRHLAAMTTCAKAGRSGPQAPAGHALQRAATAWPRQGLSSTPTTTRAGMSTRIIWASTRRITRPPTAATRPRSPSGCGDLRARQAAEADR